MEAIYEKLKAVREASGLRQGQIAEFLGVTQTYISKIESGERTLTVDQLEKLAGLYGCSLAAFEEETPVIPMTLAFRAQDVGQADLEAIAEIGRIAANSRFMAELLGETDD